MLQKDQPMTPVPSSVVIGGKKLSGVLKAIEDT